MWAMPIFSSKEKSGGLWAFSDCRQLSSVFFSLSNYKTTHQAYLQMNLLPAIKISSSVHPILLTQSLAYP